MVRCRLWIVGLGTVGRWLLRALRDQESTLRDRHGVSFEVVGLANRGGFVHRAGGLDIAEALARAEGGGALRELPGVDHWPTALAGMAATEADVLVEVSASPQSSAEPGLSHLELALERGIPTVTSNKWPVALHGVRLRELARRSSTAFRAEATVMSGTPLLSTLTEGLAGAAPIGLRGVLNATANFILTERAAGASYEAALAEAQRRGLAEPDPSADVDGHDTTAKLMVLAGLVFGQQLELADVARRGIATVTDEEMREATAAGRRIRELATLEVGPDGPALTARVEPVALSGDDPLARVDGVDNAVVLDCDPLGRVTVIGPGAGPALAGQGVLSDLLAVARPRDPVAAPRPR